MRKHKIKVFKWSEAFIEHSSDMDDIYENVIEYNPHKKRKILIEFDYIIADMPCNKILNAIVTELFITGSKLNMSLIFISFCYSK